MKPEKIAGLYGFFIGSLMLLLSVVYPIYDDNFMFWFKILAGGIMFISIVLLSKGVKDEK